MGGFGKAVDSTRLIINYDTRILHLTYGTSIEAVQYGYGCGIQQDTVWIWLSISGYGFRPKLGIVGETKTPL